MLLRPDEYLTGVTRIDLDRLASAGVKGLIIDLDNTLLPRDTNEMPPALRTWTDMLHTRGIGVCLVSNNWHERVHKVAADLGFPLVAKAIKPLPFAFWRALRVLGLKSRECAVVGDQIFTDVLGGNLIGSKTILVRPLSTADLPHTLVLRRLESLIMQGREPSPTTGGSTLS
ncbi:MAG: YqeG family HAD IIIA-type phosphatase [Coriobacteriia bacterium]